MTKITPTVASAHATTGPLVVAPVYDGLCTFEFSIVAEVFGLSRPEMGPGWYRFASAAIEPGPLRAHGGLRVTADGGADLLEQADLIVMAGWKGVHVPVPDELVQRLRKAWARGARLASICSGAFVLAATGLLDGRRAATHWRYAKALQAAHPSIDVDASVLYAEGDRVFTSAGSAAGIDLMLHIVRGDFGVEAANSVARRLVMPPHRSGGQAQFIERPVPADGDQRLVQLLDQVRADLQAPWTVDQMASHVAMSPRTFLRRFVELTGQSPGQWVTAERMEHAKRLLEGSALSVERIATEVGLGSLQALRHHFQQQLGLSPRDYRATFGRPQSAGV
ncbi:transcriptional regulator FtrA [Rhodoferax saidenbachensis]|uniref:Transcriptional regulator FtrA n=1 Tax=Rhodoferax saidenbachensis TaxID=1484693 RepID=A0A1P8KAJ1_9BURK|nr:transcriptional regulator FtrA [Rhodoferax saidenbachensis]APW43011.1 transcriptional regulator FtrA [Rhodoferax saidenbachensis]